MSIFVMIAVAACVTALSWLALLAFQYATAQYRQVFTEKTRMSLSDVFLFLNPQHIWQLTLISSVTTGVLLYLLLGHAWLASIGAGLIWLLPKPIIKYLRIRRQRLFDQQLPDALLFLAGSLKAGLGVQTSIAQLLTDAPSPLAQEFGLLLNEQRLGQPLDTCLLHLQQRMPTETTYLLVAALRVAHETGGNLAQTVESIAHTIRTRLHLEGRISALTSQGKMQAWIVGLMPLLLFFILYQLDSDRMAFFWSTPIGIGALVLWAVLECIGVAWIYHIVSIKV